MIKNTETLVEIIQDKYNKSLETFKSTFNFHMSVITKEILKEVKPISIYLIGSFGRDEGSFYLSGEAITPLRDYDVLIVVSKRVKEDVVKKIRRNIHSRLGLPDPFSRDFKFKGFTVWITQVTLKDVNALPMLKFYELKKASTLLWGRDIRNNIHLSFEDVSAYNGVLILFSKIEGLLGLLDINALKQNKNAKTIDLVYECMKTYTEFGTCLSLLIKIYEPSFLGRCSKLFKNFDALFPKLRQMSNNLPTLMVTYAIRRLLIEDDFLTYLNLGKLLSRTVKDLKIMIWYYLRKAYKVDIAFSPIFTQVFDDYVKKLNSRVLEDLIDYFMNRKLGFRSKIVRELAIRLYLRYILLKFFIRSRKRGYRIKPGILFMRNGNIMMKLWLTGLTLLGSVKEDFKVDESALYMVASKLCEMVDPSYIEQCGLKENLESRFSHLQRITLGLLDIADRIFHRKD